MSAVLIAAAALVLDWLLGEPRRRHPLVGFGQLALCCERRLYGGAGVAPGARRARGACATLLLLAPFTAAAATVAEVPYLGTVVCVAVLYLALGHRSLHDHARPVAAALSAGDEARGTPPREPHRQPRSGVPRHHA
ncbi:MAG: cobalamin biosynthesis protein, partial [Pseudomonadota bacterium]|nr:cobalamin biosynthesis protein [Pseudomonadota bacterium]